jgi:hypothetical protein
MKTFFLFISIALVSHCFGQTDSLSNKDYKIGFFYQDNINRKVEMSDYSSGRLTLMINGIILKDSVSISRFFNSAQKGNSIRRLKYYSPKRVKRKFGFVTELGAVRLWSKRGRLIVI